MALECIHYRKFTHQSDVWSYGECPLNITVSNKDEVLMHLIFIQLIL